MTDLAIPSRSDYVADLQTGTVLQGTITVSGRTVTIEPTKSTVSESVGESTSAADSINPFPRVS